MQLINRLIHAIAQAIADAIRADVQAALDKQTRALIACFNAYTERLEQSEAGQAAVMELVIESLNGLTEIVVKMSEGMRAEHDSADWWKG